MIYLFFLIGLVLGSFASVLVTRVPKDHSIGGRSVCLNCNVTLQPHHLIPLLSFIALRGRCAGCQKSISALYPLTELLSAACFVFAYTVHMSVVPSALLALALWLLLVMSIIDMQTHTISDALSIPFIAVSAIYGYLVGDTFILSMMVGGGFFAALWLVSRGRWIGSGDILLGLGIGALLGNWHLTVFSLFATYICGAAIICLLLLCKRVDRKSYIAFGPFLALGTLITLMFRHRVEVLLDIYIGI